MRIIVSDVAAEMGGAIIILKGLYEHILENDKENEWIFLLSRPIVESKGNIEVLLYPDVKKSPLHRVMFDLFEGKKLEKKYKPDLFFSLQNNLFKGVRTPQAVYMQQSLPFQDIKSFSPFKRGEFKSFYYQKIVGASIKRSLPKAEKIIVQTKWIRDAVAEKCGIPGDKILIVNPKVEPITVREDVVFDPSSFFSPITDVTYKNMDCIVGATKLLMGEKFRVLVTFDGVSEYENIEYTGFLKRDLLEEHYLDSVMIYPSYIETFGLPMAEAKTAGTIIFASDCPFSHEILDGYENAYFFDPFKPEELAGLMRKSISGEIVKKPVKAKDAVEKGWKDIIDFILGL